MVESALVFTAFAATLIGIIDVGQYLFQEAMMAERIRVGLRYAVVNSFDATKVRNVVVYNNSAPGTGTHVLFGLDTSMVTVSRTQITSTSAQVKISISATPLAMFGPLLAHSFPNVTYRGTLVTESEGATQ